MGNGEGVIGCVDKYTKEFDCGKMERKWMALGDSWIKAVFIFNEVVFFSQVRETGAHLNVFWRGASGEEKAEGTEATSIAQGS